MLTKQFTLFLFFFTSLTSLIGQDLEMMLSTDDISVNDYTNTLSQSDIDLLRSNLSVFHEETGSQIAILIISELEPRYTLEDFSRKAALTMQVGREGIDDGVLILIVKDSRLLRIEVGDGLEGAIPDAMAKRIIDEYLVPYFRSGDFVGGLTASVNAIQILIRGESLPPPVASAYVPYDAESAVAGIIICTVGFILGLILAFVKKWWVWILIVVVSMLLSWWISELLYAWILGGIFLFWKLISILAEKSGGSSYSGYSSSSSYSSSSYSSSYSSSSSSGSSSYSSGGGYSGGGGGFSGGGASGSW